ncbi:TrkH family potassium uptake protein [Loktanella salsilacus]|jgi:trk system potassium uptake protein TrkH|uniref:Trk system potassium uptake protein n=1 Tax=Loktanella salsilacus TaxID=195913 RepID=A0A1I4FTA8_9RHOB|nr:TrkH family potassium uptake protein [Loktanella salsilacus]MBU0860628.1 TrkH family potassium uptake protein [Alphaproteobacteria bacterium]MBU1836871.1 TrkH family potassium uptake protein [Alphaproteobacteria bacterium]UTH43505.1 TrkH family potassium uptake protein [Loktanella salsilacus]UTH47226.1 TrkH family potassium uptake protein [Loktanella salsilacus]SFL21078.1 trk system potassium uptake protein TrkH [Loktanella salsilacus]|tara:strand:+ start:380 stop:1828 length:1449 start_codon:yes stop_codon:yes gene_type:complete
MIDLRPVGYVIGLLVATLGLTMLPSFMADLLAGNGHWPVFLESAIITSLTGTLLAMSCANGVTAGLTVRQTFLLTSTIWITLPLFGAIPFIIGATNCDFTDAYFEAMSGLTTTGATVLGGLEALPEGIKLWRGTLQWLGGIGIIVVAMVFLPELRVGGMQIFRSESFDTMGKILPRAGQIASRISVIYVGLTLACALTYSALGMPTFDAVVHAMTTLSTGGMANTDSSFGIYGAGIHYVGAFFMFSAALPFVRYVQLLGGSAKPLMRDSQVRTFFWIIMVCVLMITAWVWGREGQVTELAFREALFNVVSIISGTGYASADYMAWGTFPVVMFFFIGLIGGCAGSTACSIKVFRYQLLFASLKAQIRQIHSPHGVFIPRYEGRPVGQDVLNSVMAMFVLYILLVGIFSVLLGLTGLDFITSVSGAATALANVGPGLGTEIGPAGNFVGLNDTAKWLLAAAMWIGRLEIMVVLVIMTRRFWRE